MQIYRRQTGANSALRRADVGDFDAWKGTNDALCLRGDISRIARGAYQHNLGDIGSTLLRQIAPIDNKEGILGRGGKLPNDR